MIPTITTASNYCDRPSGAPRIAETFGSQSSRENLTFVLIAAKKIKFGFVSAFLTEILLEGETTHSEFMYNLYLSIISMFDLSNIFEKGDLRN